MQNVFGRQIELKVHCCVAQVLDYNCLSISIKSWGAPKASLWVIFRDCVTVVGPGLHFIGLCKS